MTSLYVITRILTFFGAQLRATWELIVCRICKIPVEDNDTFKMSEMCGHIDHDIIKSRKKSFAVCFVPFALNFILACCFLLSGSYRIFYIGDMGSFNGWIFLWFGISCAANCVPSFEDVLSFKDCFYKRKTNIIIKILLAPFYAVIYGCSVLERYSLTFLMAIAFAGVFPQIFNFIVF